MRMIRGRVEFTVRFVSSLVMLASIWAPAGIVAQAKENTPTESTTPTEAGAMESPTATPTESVAVESPTATESPAPAESPTTELPTGTASQTSSPPTETPTSTPTATQLAPTATLAAATSTQEVPTLTLSATADTVLPGGAVTIAWQLQGISFLERELALQVVLGEGLSPDEALKHVYDATTRTLTIPVADAAGTFDLVGAENAGAATLDAALMEGGKVLATAFLNLAGRERFSLSADGGAIAAMQGRVKLTFPPGALNEAAMVEIGSPGREALPAGSLSGRPFEVTAKGAESSESLHRFAGFIEIEVVYDPEEMPAGAGTGDLFVYWYRPESRTWQALSSWVDQETQTIHAVTDHFSIFDIGMNNWQASHPPTVDAFQVAEFTGAATYAMPIELPAGPGGLQPSMSLAYNSQVVDQATTQAQAPWVGMGWSLDVGSIERDTHGTATELTDDTFLLSLNGTTERLVKDPSGNGIVWHTADENYWSFRLDNSIWTVRDKQGSTYTFADIATMAYWEFGEMHYLDYRWSLTSVQNRFGQEVLYTYDHATKTVVHNDHTAETVTAVYPATITYPNERYRVRFERESRTDYPSEWETDDIHHAYEKERLKEIHVEQDADGDGEFETSIHRYELTYSSGTGAENQIFPGFTYTAGGRMSTLRSVKQYGLGGADDLPATTFAYGDNLHVTRAENGYGGVVEFSYEPWYDSGYAMPSHYRRTRFGWTDEPCEQGYGPEPWHVRPGTGFVGCFAGAMRVSGVATVSGYEKDIFRPGGTYRVIVTADVDPNEQLLVGLYSGSGDELTSGSTAIVSMPATATVAEPLIVVNGGVGQVHKFEMELLSSIWRVTQKRVYDGNGHQYDFGYGYTGPAFNNASNSAVACPPSGSGQCYFEAGSEFRGHSQVIEVGPDGRLLATGFQQNDAYKGRPIYTVVLTGGGRWLRAEGYGYTSSELPATSNWQDLRRRWTSITSAVQQTYDNSGGYASTLSVYGYAATYGNLTSDAQYAWNGSSWDLYRTTVTDYYPNAAQDGSVYLVGLPARQQVKNAGGTVLAETLYLYDNNGTYNSPPTVGTLRALRTLVSGSQYAEVTYAYDAWANVTGVTTYKEYGTASSAPTSGARTTSTGYESDYHTYPDSITNALNRTTSLEYDFSVGAPVSETDPNGAVTSAEYDAFGRLTSITRPLDGAPTLGIGYSDAFPFTTTLTQRVDESTTYAVVREYDGLGREMQSNAAGILTGYNYDGYGRVTSRSTPHTASETAYFTTTSYDLLGRPLAVSAPDGTSMTFSYNGLSSTATNARGYSTTTTADVWGRTVSVTPPTGPGVTYTYDELDRLQTAARGGLTTTVNYDNAGRKLNMSDPDMGTWQYGYDALGNLTSQTDARGCTLAMEYDALNRLDTKNSSGGGCGTQASIDFGYDTGSNGIGRRTGMSDGSGSTAWSYDARGRLIGEMKTIGGTPFTTGWTYNSADLPVTMTYPDDETVTPGYDGRMLPDTLGGDADYVQDSLHDSAGRLTSRELGNGLQATYTYYPWTSQGGRLENALTGTLQDLNYSYDAVGNIAQIRDDIASETSNYTYDSLDRIGSWTLNSTPEAYTYDAATGNLATKAGSAFTYDANHPHGPSAFNGNTYGYDANGNQTTRVIGGQSYTLGYDAEGHLVSVSGPGLTASFTYDGDGARRRSIINGTTTKFVGNYYELTGSTVTKYYYAGGQRVAMRQGEAVYYLLADHLGSTSITTDAAGALTAELRYKAWGELRYASGSTPTHYTYTGQYSNVGDFGMLYYNARWYDPALSHFAQADTIVPGAGYSQAWDRYAYVLNSPVTWSDPSGHGAECGTQAGTACGNFGPKVPTLVLDQSGISISRQYGLPVQTVVNGTNNAWAVTTSAYGILFDPVDWATMAADCARGDCSPWMLAGVLPFVPGSAGKYLGRYGDDLGSLIQRLGFETPQALKAYLGPAGTGRAWHHIVEQSQIVKSGFPRKLVNSIDNVISVDAAIHAKISGFYSSKAYGFGGLRVRDWLAGKSFQEQYQFGLGILRDYGIIP